MDRYVRPVLIICVTACVIQLGLGLDCYKCSSLDSPNCSNSTDVSKLKTEKCPSNSQLPNYCSKTTFEFQNKLITYRQCEHADDCKKLLEDYRSMFYIDSFKSCDICSGDLCNSASNVKVTATFVLAFFALFYMLF